MDQLGATLSYGYTALGQRAWRLDARGQRTTYAYDPTGRLTLTQYLDDSRVTQSYDGAGRRASLEDGTGATSYAYHPGGLLAQVVSPGNRTLSYDYDGVGNRTSLVLATGAETRETDYTYQETNRIWYLVNHHAERTTYSYDAAGHETLVVRANETRATSTYNEAGWLHTVQDEGTDMEYGFDRAGLRVAMGAVGGDLLTTWSYDGASQLVRSQHVGEFDISYSYDAAGNRLQQVRTEGGGVATYSYGGPDRGEPTHHPDLRHGDQQRHHLQLRSRTATWRRSARTGVRRRRIAGMRRIGWWGSSWRMGRRTPMPMTGMGSGRARRTRRRPTP